MRINRHDSLDRRAFGSRSNHSSCIEIKRGLRKGPIHCNSKGEKLGHTLQWAKRTQGTSSFTTNNSGQVHVWRHVLGDVANLWRWIMSETERYEVFVIGSGESGKWITWTMAQAGHRTAVVERKYIGGSCPNVACLPSKNVIRSAKANWFARHSEEYGIQAGPVSTDMRRVFNRKRKMVEGEVQFHLDRFRATGAELIKSEARFVAPKTVEVNLRDEGRRTITGDRVFLDLGSRSMIPDIVGLAAAKPMTHVEALDLDRLPGHVIVLGGGYVGLELAQALRRFGSAVTVIERGSQIAAAEDADVAQALLENFTSEGIEVLLDSRVREVQGLSGQKVRVLAENSRG